MVRFEVKIENGVLIITASDGISIHVPIEEAPALGRALLDNTKWYMHHLHNQLKESGYEVV